MRLDPRRKQPRAQPVCATTVNEARPRIDRPGGPCLFPEFAAIAGIKSPTRRSAKARSEYRKYRAFKREKNAGRADEEMKTRVMSRSVLSSSAA